MRQYFIYGIDNTVGVKSNGITGLVGKLINILLDFALIP